MAENKAKAVYIASDAEKRLVLPITELCEQSGVAVFGDVTMKELGEACGIEVGAAVAAVIE